MNQRKRFALTFAAAFCSTIVLATSFGAEALHRRIVGSVCQPFNDSDIVKYGNGVFNYSTTTTTTLSCPVPDDSYLAKEQLLWLNLHGSDEHSGASVTARACIANWDVPGGGCGTMASSGNSFVGSYGLQPSRAEWNAANGGDFAYVELSLPPKTGFASNLRGFFVAN